MNINKNEILVAQENWGKGIVEIGDEYSKNLDYESRAIKHIKDLYAYEFLNGEVRDENYPIASKYFNELRGSMTNKDLEYIMTQYANPIVAKKEMNNE